MSLQGIRGQLDCWSIHLLLHYGCCPFQSIVGQIMHIRSISPGGVGMVITNTTVKIRNFGQTSLGFQQI